MRRKVCCDRKLNVEAYPASRSGIQRTTVDTVSGAGGRLCAGASYKHFAALRQWATIRIVSDCSRRNRGKSNTQFAALNLEDFQTRGEQASAFGLQSAELRFVVEGKLQKRVA